MSLKIERKNLEEAKEKKDRLHDHLVSLEVKFEKSGGGRIERIEEQLKNLQNEFIKRDEKLKNYKNLLKKANLPFSRDYRNFLKLKENLSDEITDMEKEKIRLISFMDSIKYNLKKYNEEFDELESEIIYLKTHKTNIPRFLSEIRDKMQETLNIKLVFVAELIEVENKEFEGVIERILRNFGMSLLVDEDVYDEVSEYINNTYLGAKLVYLKIANKTYSYLINENKKLLINNIRVKESKFKDYILQRIASEFDYILCDSLEEFKKLEKAATKEGLVKSGIKHEKDDRFRVNDKSRYILGSNEEKLNALINKRNVLDKKIKSLTAELNDYNKKLSTLEEKREIFRDIIKIEFDDIDIFSIREKTDVLNEEKENLLKNTELSKLKEEIKNVKISLKSVEGEIGKINEKIGEMTNEKSRLNLEISELKKVAIDDEEFEREFNIKTLSLEKLKNRKKELQIELKTKIQSLESSKTNYDRHLIKKMSEYLNEYKFFEKFADASIESADEFIKRLKKLKDDDLPRFEKDFKRHFEEGTLHNILKINEEINRALKEIKNKIALINKNLKDIEYNPSTFIEIDIKPSKDKDLKEFKDALKYLSSNIAEGLNESKFLKIKELISKLQGVDERVEKKWREKVCDVRNYYTFAAIEKYYNGEVREYYSDSSGKSGGQKEKLAYTILASALSYQFSLLDENPKSRTFRFAMIDEAFGKGSDESARYALELFKKLDLQMLIVTPKQKINVIAPYVGSVHFVFNKNSESILVDMPVERVMKSEK